MQIRKEIYNLSKSNPISISEKQLDIKIDVVLNDNKNPLNINSSVSGIIVDTLNNPIKDAIVKLINSNLEPLATTRTDDNGKYFINIVTSSTRYTVLATSVEKRVNQCPSFILNNWESKIINFTLSNDPYGLFGAISGTLTDGNNKALKGAVIFLHKVDESITNLFAITYSDLQGTFFFSELLEGKYKISVQSLISTPYEEIIIVESKKIYNFNKSLSFISNLSEGSISGAITDNLGNNIPKADVILYKVENNIKTPVAFTKTNSFGLYSFSNVPFGYYLVKSNATQSLDINNIISPSVKITSTSELGTYNLAEGILENGAIIDNSTKFVTSLGGINDGSVSLTLNVSKYGFYTLIIYYVAADFNRPLKITVNKIDVGEVYRVPITSGWEKTDIQIIQASTSLNEGLNIVKFHGDGKNLAPNINNITLISNETESNITFTKPFIYSNNEIFENISIGGVYSNGAKYNEGTFLATLIGGPTDGSVSISVEVKELVLYYMVLKYVANDSKLPLKIDINNNYTNIYTLPKTNNIKFSNSQSFTLPIAFNKYINDIKFHGDGKNYAPDLDSCYFKIPPITANFAEGFLENNAKVFFNENFVLGIGGPQNGAVAVSVDIGIYGYYKLFIEYLGTTTTLPLRIDVNGINNSTITHLVPPSGDLNINNKKIFSVILYLNTGINTLRFYGNGKELAPNLSYFKVIKTNLTSGNNNSIDSIQEIYDVKDAKLSGSAILDKDNKFINFIGGKSNGTASFNVIVRDEGEYVLQITYYILGRFKIDVNGVSQSDFYRVLGNTYGVFKTIIKLKAGINTLKFYGYSQQLAPYLGNFMINLNSPLSLRLDDFLLKNNAKILPSKVITSIGGRNEGYVLINYFAITAGEYTLNIIVSNENKNLLILINYDTVKIIKNIPKINSPTISYSETIILNSGDNLIEFLGNSRSDSALDIYNISINPFNYDISKFIFNLENANLKNSAEINSSNGFIKNIGTKENGIATLIIEVDSTDFYDLNIEYINSYTIDTPLRLKVNDKILETTYYIPMNENIYNINEIKVFVISKISLNKGKNSIEFSGNGIDPVAHLGKVRLSKFKNTTNEITTIYYATDGKLENGAKIATFSKNFIDKIGGSKIDGSVTIKVNVDEDSFYDLLIEYLVTIDNNSLLIDINNEDTGSIYTLPKTEGLKEENSKNFIIAVFLSKGDNTIKFHGDKINVAPNLGRIYINKSPERKNYVFLNATLKNAEEINSPKEFISLNGSLDNSYAYVKVNVEKDGDYYLTLKYLSRNVNSINIRLSRISYNKTFTLPATKKESVLDAKLFTFKIPLISGENIIFFIKPKKNNDNSVLLHSFSISTDKLIQTVSMKKALLLKGAYFNENTGFAQGLGGLTNGYAIIDIPVSTSGLYDLVVNYLSLKIQRKLKVTINDIPTKTNYYFPTTGEIPHKLFVKSVTIPISLKVGMNKIKLHGKHESTECPMISEINLSFNLSNIIKIYYLSDGIFKKGAIADTQYKTVSNIGGKNAGEVTIDLNISKAGIYNINLQYKSLKSSSGLYLDINNSLNPKPYKLPMTSNAFFKTFSIKAYLELGNNSMTFYGDANNNNLILGNFTLTSDLNSPIFKDNEFTSNVSFGELKNGADIYLSAIGKSWANKLGGSKNGSSTLTIDVNYDGEYTLILEYLILKANKSNTFTLAFHINSKSTGQIYTFTSNNYYRDIITRYEFNLNLVKGKNKIKFSGDGKNQCPLLGDIILTLKYIKI